MKPIIQSLLLTICLHLGCSAAFAAEEPMKIGVLDWQQLLSKAPQAEEAGKRLEREFQKPKDDLLNKQKEFQTKRDKLQRDRDVMSAAERAKKEKELANMEAAIRRKDEDLRSNYTTRHREEMDNFIAVVRGEVEKLAKDQKYDLVIPQEATLYMADRIDITDSILAKLEKLPKSATAAKEDKKADKADKSDSEKSES